MMGHKCDHVFSDTKYKVNISHTDSKVYIITKQITTIQHTDIYIPYSYAHSYFTLPMVVSDYTNMTISYETSCLLRLPSPYVFILDAVLMVSPNKQYLNIIVPTIPAIHEPRI